MSSGSSLATTSGSSDEKESGSGTDSESGKKSKRQRRLDDLSPEQWQQCLQVYNFFIGSGFDLAVRPPAPPSTAEHHRAHPGTAACASNVTNRVLSSSRCSFCHFYHRPMRCVVCVRILGGLQEVSERVFLRLCCSSKADEISAAAILQRILAGAHADDEQHDKDDEQQDCKECFLVQRTDGSKSKYQVQTGAIRMVAQKVFLA